MGGWEGFREHRFGIRIDNSPHIIVVPEVIGSDLRVLAGKRCEALGYPDFDLWLRDEPEDRLIQPFDIVKLRDDMRFYTAPSRITAGAA